MFRLLTVLLIFLVGVTEAGETVLIPAGPFIMGSDEVDPSLKSKEFGTRKPFFADEHPQRKIDLPAFRIDKYEVTQAEYAKFVVSKGRVAPASWIKNGYAMSSRRSRVAGLSEAELRSLVSEVFRLDLDTHALNKTQLLAEIEKRWASLDALPVTYVSWHDADDYCRWVGGALPSEVQWEKAARGPEGYVYPWGNEWQPGFNNTGEQTWPDGVAPVGSYSTDRSVYGVYDLSGNAYEWVDDWYQAYPGSNYRSDAFGRKFKVVRGYGAGSEGHYALSHFQRGAHRLFLNPDTTNAAQGFRCVKRDQ